NVIASSLNDLPETEASQMRVVRATPVANRSDRFVSFIIQLDAPGDAHALGFSLNFDPNRLHYAGATSSREMSRAAFIVNADRSEARRVPVRIILPPPPKLPSSPPP